MGRGRVELKRIENKVSRQVTFSKRRSGLLKKAREISVLCEAQVAAVVFSAMGKLFEFSSVSSIDEILERYERYASAQRQFFPSSSTPFDKSQGSSVDMEFPKLSAKLEALQRNLRNFLGEDIDPLSLKEVKNLEHQIQVGLKRVRARKNQVMQETVSVLQKKARALQEQNDLLQKEMKEAEKLLIPEERTNRETVDLNTSAFLGEQLPEREGVERSQPATTNMAPWILNHRSQ